MRHSLLVTVLLIGMVVAARSSGQAILPDAKIPTLHVLIVADTDSNIGESVAVDRDQITKLFKEAFATRPSRLRLAPPLDGKKATPGKIVAHYANLKGKVKPIDTLLFYYTGHGDTTAADGHRLRMEKGTLTRKELRQAMQALKPRLIVLLTDCCSEVSDTVRAKALPPLPQATWPVMDCLFFNHEGITDVNGCQEGALSWCYLDKDGKERGGTFTLALVPLLCAKLESFGGTFVTWDAFAPRLKNETNVLFKQLWDVAGPRDRIRKQTEQAPQIFSLARKREQNVPDPRWMLGARFTRARRGGQDVCVIVEVFPGTPAAAAGLKEMDLIVKVDGIATPTAMDCARAIDYSSGTSVVEIERKGKRDKVKVSLRPVKPPMK